MASAINSIETENLIIDGISIKDKMNFKKIHLTASPSKLPYYLAQGSAVVLNDEIHILGCDLEGNYTNHYKWNGSSWTSVSTLLTRHCGGSVVLLNGDIHALGSNNINYNEHYIIDGLYYKEVV